MRATPATPQEAADIEVLNAMMGGSLDPAQALRVLRKHNNNLDKAASALLEGDTGEGDANPYADLPSLETLDTATVGPRTPPREPEKPVIDLTKDDDDNDLARALQASLEEHQAPTFGPSNRAPDPNWAMVPSNAEVSGPVGMSQDEQAMSRAIEASLSYNINEDTYEELPLEERVRKGDTPVALRPTSSGFTYAALVLHALFFVPQVRNAIAEWLPRPDPGSDEDVAEISPPTSGAGWPVWTMLELFANMDLARLSELSVDAAMNAFSVEPWSNPSERPGDLSYRFYDNLAYAVEHTLKYNNLRNPDRKPHRQVGYVTMEDHSHSHTDRLLSLQYGLHDAEPDDPSIDNLCCVKVTVGVNPDANDLVSSLAAELAPDPSKSPSPKRQVIIEPSDVITFQLLRDVAPPPYDAAVGRRTERAIFKYPKSVFLDQFMKDSFELANEKRTARRKLLQEVKELEARKKSLLHHNDKDTLADLQSCLYYYETVAEDDDDPNRAEEIRHNREKLTQIIEKVKAEADSIESSITRLQAEANGMLDCPELQQHRYDLRAVIVHDGLFGRSHLYSYVKYKGKWWKTVDYMVTEVRPITHAVSEDSVLNDSTGLHLGAGPYFLLYSRAVSQEEEDARAPWHESLKDAVKYNNRIFFEQLPPEVASRVVDPNSPPSSPLVTATPTEHTIESDIVEPPESRDELMDTTE
ncbi:hypothetical protein BD414DRAFT_560365 [Trametes punicea]|nr:hypothetical protein BD414DRAFT_560365 [Trametes punicea]